MKITNEHYTYMKEIIESAMVNEKPFQLESEYKDQGLSPKRFRWDCAYAARLTPWICDNIYSYADDDHIDTALRSIMRDLGCTWASTK